MARGGHLASYSSLREQLLVERYLRGSSSLPVAVSVHPSCPECWRPGTHAALPEETWRAERRTRPLTALTAHLQGYWIGVSREAPGAAWTASDQAALSQVAANMPYSHWGWSFAGDALTTGADCGLAAGSLAYDYYNGDRWARR